MADEPDLMAELDDADLIISGDAEKIVYRWGVRWSSGYLRRYGRGTEGETVARMSAADALKSDQGASVVKQKVTYGKWTNG